MLYTSRTRQFAPVAEGGNVADIISLVKHAGRGEPLLSAAERVDRAMACLRAGRTFSPEQERWLELIHNHLVENLTIEREDFDLITFTRLGATWEQVNRDFSGHLEETLTRINEAMAA